MGLQPVLVVALCVLGITSVSARENSAPEQLDEFQVVFREGNALYEEGDYAGAIDRYRLLADRGVVDAALDYNLGNASYKNNDLGSAVLYYERSLRLEPRNKDARENLELVRTQLKDKQFVKTQNRFIGAAVVLHRNLSTSEMFVFASIAYLVLCLASILFMFRNSRFLSNLHKRLSIVSPGRLLGLTFAQELLVVMGVALILVVPGVLSTYEKVESERKRTDAVVMTDEIPVFGSPTEDATLQFRIHEGTKLRIQEVRGDWAKIQLPGGLSGWVVARAVERI